MPSRLRFCTDWAAGGPPRESPTLLIVGERWLRAAGGRFPTGRLQKPMPLKQKSDVWRRHEVELGFVEKYWRGCLGWASVRVRYGRDFGHHRCTDASLRAWESRFRSPFGGRLWAPCSPGTLESVLDGAIACESWHSFI